MCDDRVTKCCSRANDRRRRFVLRLAQTEILTSLRLWVYGPPWFPAAPGAREERAMQSVGHSHIRRRAGQLCQHLPGARVEPGCQADEHGRCTLPPAASPTRLSLATPGPTFAGLQQTPEPDPVYREQGAPPVRRTPPRCHWSRQGPHGNLPKTRRSGGDGDTGVERSCTHAARWPVWLGGFAGHKPGGSVRLVSRHHGEHRPRYQARLGMLGRRYERGR